MEKMLTKLRKYRDELRGKRVTSEKDKSGKFQVKFGKYVGIEAPNEKEAARMAGLIHAVLVKRASEVEKVITDTEKLIREKCEGFDLFDESDGE